MTHEQFALYLPSILAFAAFALAAYVAFRQESREDGQTTTQRLRKIETVQANQDLRQQGLQVEMENVADYGKRERQTMVENAIRDHNTIKDMIKDVPTMRELVYRMVERLENMKETNIKLDAKMDRIVELLTHK